MKHDVHGIEWALSYVGAGHRARRREWKYGNAWITYVATGYWSMKPDLAGGKSILDGEDVTFAAFLAIKTDDGKLQPWQPDLDDLTLSDWEDAD